MKLNQIAIASLLMVAGSSFAATAALCTGAEYKTVSASGSVAAQTEAENFVNSCTPGVTFFVAGSSALGGSIKTIVTKYFDTTIVPVIEIVDGVTPNGVNKANATQIGGLAGNGSVSFYGMSKATLTTVSVPLHIIYNSYMGSAAGVSALMAKDLTKVPEANTVSVGPIAGVKNTCVEVPTLGTAFTGGGSSITVKPGVNNTTVTKMVACTASTSASYKRADIAISDVNVNELLEMYDVSGGVKLTALQRKPLAMQGFAVAVNKKFYNALMAAQVTSGALPAACVADTYTEICQPSITRAQYASLVTKDGTIKSAAGFIPSDTTKLILSRRDQMSGTQASSNIYFASGICNVQDPKSKVNTHGGALTVARATDYPASATFEIRERVQSGDVKTDLANTTDYVIGVLGLSEGASTAFRFVKIDGASPNFVKLGDRTNGSAASGSLAATPNLRANLIDGSWGFQMAAFAAYPTASAASYDKLKTPKANLINQVVADLSDSTLTSLPLGYIDGAADPVKKSKVSRLESNNCSPLINK